MTTISTVAAYTGAVPNRSQSQTTFNTNVNDILTYIDSFPPDLNTSIGEMNTVAGEVNADAAAAAQDASDAASSAIAATATANATVYSGATTYNYPEAVIGSDGHTYRCIGTGVLGDNPVGSVTGNWRSLTIGSRHVTNEAALGTGEAEGQLAVTADDRVYTWNSGTSKWIARNGNTYTTSPSFSNVTFPGGAIISIAGQQYRYNGSTWDAAGKVNYGELSRPRFVISTNTLVLIPLGAAGYHLAGVGWCWISSTIIKILDGLVTNSVWNYVYIDKSNFTSPRAILDTDLIISTTAPTESLGADKRGYYNGDDRAIFMGLGSGTGSFEKMYNDGTAYVHYDAHKSDLSAASINTTWTDVTLTIPTICTSAMASFLLAYVDAASNLLWRVNGSGGTGHAVCRALASTAQFNQAIVFTDSNNKIEVATNTASAQTASVQTNGFYLPLGM